MPSNEIVSIPGGSASYTCTTSVVTNEMIASVQWLVNGTIFEELQLDNVTATRVLMFSMISMDYNNTSIRCRATLASGSVKTSNVSMLLIQG